MKRALLSVYDKSGLADFAQGLAEPGYELLSTGGTAKALRDAGLRVTDISDVTGFPELFGGRVKTLHPLIFGGILQRRDSPEDARESKKNSVGAIDLVCVNLYPFEETAATSPPLPELLEQIDIGGPSLIRAAAKSHADVLVVVDPADYDELLQRLVEERCDPDYRLALAAKAFNRTALYDAHIERELSRRANSALPGSFGPFGLERTLRYGENPHQRAALYTDGPLPFKLLHGKPLSYNNLLDLGAAVGLAHELGERSAVVVKHLTPCGAALKKSLFESFEAAYGCDRVSAFGGVIALAGEVDEPLALRLNSFFNELVAAPRFTDEALAALTKKKNRRVVRLKQPPGKGLQVRSTYGGVLVQEPDIELFTDLTWAAGKPAQEPNVRFGMKVVKWCRSNAVVVVKDGAALGIGAGMTSRVEAVRLALNRAGEGAKGAALASDGFFPFPDSVELAAEAGISVVVQPGGSVRDREVIKAATRAGISLALTGMRHFLH